jgi:Spy/CpxP family protein refolding chaperone
MKKFTAVLLVLAALASSAFAHHPSPSDSAGGNMSSESGHLTNSFPAEIY